MVLGEVFGSTCMNCSSVLFLKMHRDAHFIVFTGKCDICGYEYEVKKHK